MRSRQIVAGTFARAFGVEARSSGRPEWLSCESVATKDETEAAREDAAVGGPGEKGRGGGFQVSEGKKKDDDEEDGGGVQPRWHENEA